MQSFKNTDSEYVANTYGRFDLEVAYGKGAEVYDIYGKEYIDLTAGIAVNTFGVSDPIWTDAVIKQLNSVQHMSNLYYTSPQAQLAKMLCDLTGAKKVFFSNSGAEANECAIKTARKYSFDKYGENRNVIITLKNSFHGRTVTTLSATGQDSFHKYFAPFTEGFIYVSPDSVEELIAAASEKNVCAIMLETIQGEGGVVPLTAEFINTAASLADKNDLILIIDEVQTGNGRTGKLYSYMHYDIAPDVVSTAKGLGGGLPLGATMLFGKVKDVLTAGTHGSTFGGNPVCAAGAINVLSRIDKNLTDGIIYREQLIREALSDYQISGRGLMLGIKTDKNSRDVAVNCLKKGVIVLTAKEKVRLLPPLNIKIELLEKALKILKTEL